ncbi:MAG: hypothetical protein HY078_14020 [Elusimicrobia bacterium]|nr:hypothetical protein [Elusimicrobiota bacterium]
MADEPENVERVLETASSLDSARLTLRWALERVRHLERSQAETLELLRHTQQARDQAAQALDAAKQSLDKRGADVARKESFVNELERMLKSVFNGQINVQELVEQRQELDRLKADIEADARRLVHNAEERHKRDLDEYAKRIAAMEASHAQALSEAQSRYDAQLRDVARQRQEESILQSEKESRFREDLTEQLQKQGDQYHQKLVLMQYEYAAKREELHKEFERLKTRLFEEARQLDARQGFAVRVAQTRWGQEKDQLDADLRAREARLHELEQALAAAQQAAAERDDRHRQELLASRAEQDAQSQALRAAHEQQVRSLETRLEQELEERLKDRREQAAMHQTEILALEARVNAEIQERMRAHQEELNARHEGLRQKENDLNERDQAEVRKLETQIGHLRESHRDMIVELQEKYAEEHRHLTDEFEQKLREHLDEERDLRNQLSAQKEQAFRELEKHLRIAEELRASEAQRQAQIHEVRQKQESKSQIEELKKLRLELFNHARELGELRQENQKLKADAAVPKPEKEHSEGAENLQRLLKESKAKAESLERELVATVRETNDLRRERQRLLEHPSAPSAAPVAHPSPRRRIRIVWALALAAALAAAFAWSQAPLGRDYAVPFAHASGMSWDGDDLWVSDWSEQAIFKMRRAGSELQIAKKYPFPNSRLKAVAASGQYVFSIDGWSRRIWRHKKDNALSVEQNWPAPGPNPSGIWFDGKNLWTSDLETRRIYQHNLDESLSVLASYPLPYPPTGGQSKDGSFWSMDPQTGFFYEQSLPPELSPRNILRVRDILGFRDLPLGMSCFAWKDGRLWIGEDGVNRIVERPKWMLKTQL